MDIDSLNLVLIFGLALIGGSVLYAIRAWLFRHIELREVIGIVVMLIIGLAIVRSQI